jgi:hypothetical protein
VEGGTWQTPLGEIAIDADLSGRILEELGELVVGDSLPHKSEHSLEVQLPYIQYLFPDTQIVPIMVPPESNALEIGEKIARIAGEIETQVIFIGSTDLTHYGRNFAFAPRGIGPGALEWMKNENDRRLVGICERMEAEKVLEEVEKHHNACGAGAIGALLSSVKTSGSKGGTLLKYTTSFDESGGGDYSVIVGYMGMVF